MTLEDSRQRWMWKWGITVFVDLGVKPTCEGPAYFTRCEFEDGPPLLIATDAVLVEMHSNRAVARLKFAEEALQRHGRRPREDPACGGVCGWQARRFEEMLASIDDAIMYGPHTMARFADQRRQHRADRRRRRRHARYNRGRTGVRPRMRGGR